MTSETPYGKIQTAWNRTGQQLTLDVTIPPNTTTTVYLPFDAASHIESCEIGSGSYHFAATMP